MQNRKAHTVCWVGPIHTIPAAASRILFCCCGRIACGWVSGCQHQCQIDCVEVNTNFFINCFFWHIAPVLCVGWEWGMFFDEMEGGETSSWTGVQRAG